MDNKICLRAGDLITLLDVDLKMSNCFDDDVAVYIDGVLITLIDIKVNGLKYFRTVDEKDYFDIYKRS